MVVVLLKVLNLVRTMILGSTWRVGRLEWNQEVLDISLPFILPQKHFFVILCMLGKFYQQLGLLCKVMYLLLKLSSYTCVSFIELDEVARFFLLWFEDLEIKLHDHFVVKDGCQIFALICLETQTLTCLFFKKNLLKPSK